MKTAVLLLSAAAAVGAAKNNVRDLVHSHVEDLRTGKLFIRNYRDVRKITVREGRRIGVEVQAQGLDPSFLTLSSYQDSNCESTTMENQLTFGVNICLELETNDGYESTMHFYTTEGSEVVSLMQGYYSDGNCRTLEAAREVVGLNTVEYDICDENVVYSAASEPPSPPTDLDGVYFA
jgi:hypothetical protein